MYEIKTYNFTLCKVFLNNQSFFIKLLLLIFCFLSTVHFKVVISNGDTHLTTFLPLLEYFLEPTICDGARYSYRIFLYLLYSLEKNSFQTGFSISKQDKFCLG